MADNENTFHIGLFACCRELEKKSFDFLSLAEVTSILKWQEEEKIRQQKERERLEELARQGLAENRREERERDRCDDYDTV